MYLGLSGRTKGRTKVEGRMSEPKMEDRLRVLSRLRIDIEPCLSSENCLGGDI